ncbi:MAG: lipopolysaccharide assembly protein LapB [Candidatus Sedimenticola sp. (ex Thyasira tokunagai)]
MMELLWLLLPVAAASGWFAAKRNSAQKESPVFDYTPAYFRGLNYLLNEQPDKAIDVFVEMLEVDSETVETHLALGNLFRRRGEVDRAIRIHQNLIARPTLSRSQRAQALLELGQDYMRAGLFDRAENLFKELGDLNYYQDQALENLRIIYQQEKEWRKCLEVAAKLEKLTGESLAGECAHYYCELVEEAQSRKDDSLARSLLKKARATDRESVRANLLQARMEAAEGSFNSAINTFSRIEQQDPAYISEFLPALIECYRQQGGKRELAHYLRKLFSKHQSIPSALALVDILQEDEGDETAIGFLNDYLNREPDLEGLGKLIALNLKTVGCKEEEMFLMIQQLIGKLLKNRPAYQCSRCGFTAKTLHWQCPSCNTWGSIKPHSGQLDSEANGGLLNHFPKKA